MSGTGTATCHGTGMDNYAPATASSFTAGPKDLPVPHVSAAAGAPNKGLWCKHLKALDQVLLVHGAVAGIAASAHLPVSHKGLAPYCDVYNLRARGTGGGNGTGSTPTLVARLKAVVLWH